ncbi:MAG: hypothetical protein R3Y68_10525 [Rikenellaceae bacterium]
MATTAQRLALMFESKADLKSAMEEQGLVVGTTPFSGWGDLVRTIESGGDSESAPTANTISKVDAFYDDFGYSEDSGYYVESGALTETSDNVFAVTNSVTDDTSSRRFKMRLSFNLSEQTDVDLKLILDNFNTGGSGYVNSNIWVSYVDTPMSGLFDSSDWDWFEDATGYEYSQYSIGNYSDVSAYNGPYQSDVITTTIPAGSHFIDLWLYVYAYDDVTMENTGDVTVTLTTSTDVSIEGSDSTPTSAPFTFSVDMGSLSAGGATSNSINTFCHPASLVGDTGVCGLSFPENSVYDAKFKHRIYFITSQEAQFAIVPPTIASSSSDYATLWIGGVDSDDMVGLGDGSMSTGNTGGATNYDEVIGAMDGTPHIVTIPSGMHYVDVWGAVSFYYDTYEITWHQYSEE